MPWEDQIKTAENLLASTTVPLSEAIIDAIKRVNPTRLCLPDSEKERGYELKSRLQNVLLENYGGAFTLQPDPCDARVVLIKHLFLPSIDACHAHRAALSPKALECVVKQASTAEGKGDRSKNGRGRQREADDATSPKEVLSRAQRLLDGYDYAAAERELAALQLTRGGDLASFTRGIRMLFEEIGAYGTAVDTLLAQSGRVLQEKTVRELLALAHYGSGAFSEAGAVFDTLHPSDLGKDALYAYATLALRDGNLVFSQKLLRLGEEKEGFVDGADELKRKIEQALAAEAEPVLEDAVAALARGELERAAELAREVLSCGNNLSRARRIVAVADSCAVSTEAASLWRTLEHSGERKERIQVLERLLDLDRRNEVRIRELMQAERDAEQRELVEQRGAELRAALIAEKWPECFATMRWFGHREDADEAYRSAASLSPLLQVLYKNQRLDRLPERAAEDAWLEFVEAVSLRRAGREHEALQILTRVRPHFRSFPYFEEQYEEALAVARQSAREEADRLLVKAQADGCSFAEMASIQNSMRRAASYLSPDERSRYLSSLEARSEQLRPVKGGEALLRQYETARWMGDAVRAATLAEEIGDAESIGEVEKNVAETLKVEAVPIELTVSSSLQVDVERGHHGANLYLVTDRHACLRTGPETLVFIDLREMTAWSLQSRFFTAFALQDYDSDKNLFLFRYGRDGDYFFRFVLDGAKSRFLSVIKVQADLWPGNNLSVGRLFLSSGKENEYFCILISADNKKFGRIFKFTVNNYMNPSATFSMKGEVITGMERTATDPDTFVVAAEGKAVLCNKNLTWPKRMPFGDFIYGIDRTTGKIYFKYECGLMVTNLKSADAIEYFPGGLMAGLLFPNEVIGLSPHAKKILLNFKDDKGTFYNLENNALSVQVRLSTIFCTAIPSRFYYVEYDETYSWMRLKEITEEVDELLQWKELLFANEPKETYLPKLEKLREGVDLVRETIGGGSESRGRGEQGVDKPP